MSPAMRRLDCLEWLFVELKLYIIIEYIDCVCACLHEFKIKMSEIKDLCQCVNQCVDQCLAQGQDPSDRLMPPFSMNISGPTGSGKTYYIKEIMKLPQFKNAQIHLFYCNDQPLYDEMNLASAQQGIDRLDIVLSELNPDDLNILIIDDLMEEVGKSEHVRNLVTCDVHHNKYTVIMVQQNLLPQFKYSRDLAINLRYRVVFYNRFTANQFSRSVSEMEQGKIPSRPCIRPWLSQAIPNPWS